MKHAFNQLGGGSSCVLNGGGFTGCTGGGFTGNGGTDIHSTLQNDPAGSSSLAGGGFHCSAEQPGSTKNGPGGKKGGGLHRQLGGGITGA